LVSFHPLQSMLQSWVLHTIHNYCDHINIITVSASSRILVLGSIDSSNGCSVVNTFDTLACRFDFMKDHEMIQKFIRSSYAKQFGSCRT
jgi:hypothetical protein